MSITVVTVRDDDGAPLTREVYASGDRYTTSGGILEILSAEPKALALYPSGNWLSAYIDDAVTVIAGVPRGRIGSGDDIADVDPNVAPEIASEAASVAGFDAVSNTDSSGRDRESDVDAGGKQPAPVRPERVEHPAPAAHSRWMRTVVFRPITSKPARAHQDDGPDRSHIRPVVFASRTYRAARPRPRPGAQAPAETKNDDGPPRLIT